MEKDGLRQHAPYGAAALAVGGAGSTYSPMKPRDGPRVLYHEEDAATDTTSDQTLIRVLIFFLFGV